MCDIVLYVAMYASGMVLISVIVMMVKSLAGKDKDER